jgi:hypothetical protein
VGVVKDESVAPSAVLGWGFVIAVCMLGIAFTDRRTNQLAFVACTAAAGIVYLRTILLLGRGVAGGSNRALVLCLVLAAAWRVPLLLKPPALSTDVYRYVWDGRIQRLGYDPYIVVPENSEFQQLHTTETRTMNHPDVPTPYPAAAELFFRAVVTVHESALAMKLALALCDACLVAVLLRWLLASGRGPWWVLAYAWNPLVALEGAGNGHVDLLGALCLVLTATSLARGRRVLAAVAFALGVGVKFLPAVLAPLLWRRIRLRDAALGVAVLAALYVPFLGHGRLPLGSLGDYWAYWRFNAPVYSALERVLPTAGLVGVPVGLGFAVAVWARRHMARDSPEGWAWPVAMMLFFAPTIYPWYLLWVTPFLFAPRTLPLAVWTVTSLSIYWSLPDWGTTAVEYGPVLGAAGWMLAQSLRARPATSASV